MEIRGKKATEKDTFQKEEMRKGETDGSEEGAGEKQGSWGR